MYRHHLRYLLAGAAVVMVLGLLAVLFLTPDKKAETGLFTEKAPEVSMADPVLKKGVAKSDKEAVDGVLRVRAASGNTDGIAWTYKAARPEKPNLTLKDEEGNEKVIRSSAAGAGGQLSVNVANAKAADVQKVARALLTDQDLTIESQSGRLVLRSEKLVSSGVSVGAKRAVVRDLYPVSACKELKASAGVNNDSLLNACLLSGFEIKGSKLTEK